MGRSSSGTLDAFRVVKLSTPRMVAELGGTS